MNPLVFEYKNHEGEVAIRKVTPISLWYGKTQYHTKEQWIIYGYDCNKKVNRDFAMNNIIRFINEKEIILTDDDSINQQQWSEQGDLSYIAEYAKGFKDKL